MTILYLCDGKKERCGGRSGCFYDAPKRGDCKHTTDPGHALHAPCPEPQKHPERFEPVRDKDNGAIMYYYEKDVSA